MMMRRSLGQPVRSHLEKASLFTVRPFSAPSANLVKEDSNQQPTLKKIPSLPVFGSMISAYSGIPPFDLNDFHNYWRNMHKNNGPFYSVGIPGFGSGWHGTINVIRDPQEMLKVIKKEGAHPSGLIEREWPMRTWLEKRYTSLGLLARGPEWKRVRNFVQKDLLAPASAREYLPGILKGAAKGSPKVAQFAREKNLNLYLNYAAMDMFAEILFGGDQGMSEEDYNTFCTSAVEGLAALFNVMRDPMENLYHRIGIETAGVKRFEAHMDTLDAIARRRLEGFMKQVENDDLTPEERNSYFYKLMKRQPESDVTREEMIESSVMMMTAAVDTTAAKTAWNVLQLALNPKVQEELYQQIDRAVQKEGGLTAGIFERSEVPLLSAFIRETHRCTPPLTGDIMKDLPEPTDIHGVMLPAGSTVMFDCLTNMWDPDLVEDPMEFRPERWLKAAVEARKNTPAAIIDHPFYSGPFSQGARRCPGSRVAYLEVQAMIAQLLLDWKIKGPENVHWKDVPGKLQTLFIPVFPEEVEFVPRV